MSPFALRQLFLRGKDANSVTILIQPCSFVLPVQESCTKLATGRADGSALFDGGLARFLRVQ